MLDEGGWGLDELVTAAEPGPAQDALLRTLGLLDTLMTSSYPYQLRLPLAPYRFVWRDDAAVDAEKDATDSYTQERYMHDDGTSTIIREYRADGLYHIMSDRGEIELIDNANDPYAPDPVSVVRLP